MNTAYKIIQIAGLLQGAILFSIIFSNILKQKNRLKYKAGRKSDRKNGRSLSLSYLASLILLLTFHIGAQTFINREFMIRFPYILLFIDFLPFLYGPLIYFYTFHLFFKDYKPAVPFIINTIPAAGDIIFYALLFLIGGREFVDRQMALFWAGTPLLFTVILDLLKFLSGISYSILTLRIIIKNRENLKKSVNSADRKKWLRTLTVSFIICWLPVIIGSIIRIAVYQNPSAPKNPDLLIKIISTSQIILLAGFFYILTFFTFKYPTILDPKEIREEIRKKLNLSESEINEIKKRIKNQMKNRLYLDPDLTMTETAKIIGTHPNRLSFVINEEYGINFKQFINQYRLEEFFALAQTSQIKEETILGLAFDSGFPSKTTFHRVFKEKYQMTATEFLKQKSSKEKS